MHLVWRKHRMRCPDERGPMRSFVLGDHRIAAKNCLLTRRAAKWATVQVGEGRTVTEVAAELKCDWHTVNDAVTTYGSALLRADRRRLNHGIHPSPSERAISETYDSVFEFALIQEFEIGAGVGRQRRLPTTNDHGPDVEVALVDQPGF
jgi:hypothetical protein